MFVHCVFFWLRADITPKELLVFTEGLESLTTIETVRVSHVGVPANTDREIIDRSYSHALILFFDDEEGHDLYQEHPIHDAFRDNCGSFWTQVKIYDSE